LAVPVLRYSIGLINWHREEIRKSDRKTRKIFTVYGQHHPRADTDRLYVPRKGGGRRSTQIEAAYITETTKLAEYIEGSEDPLFQVVRAHQCNAYASLPRSAHKCEKNANEKVERKRTHGQIPRSLDDMLADREQTYRWLKFGDTNINHLKPSGYYMYHMI
jgi:hypothetical protein